MEQGIHVHTYGDRLFSGPVDFDGLKRELWAFQRQHNPLLHRFTELLESDQPTFLPIRFFKDFQVKTGEGWKAQQIFESSGTTGQTPSRHFVRDLDLYKRSLLQGFHFFFEQQGYRILALLPSYLERQHSSLVYMVQAWIEHFGLPGSGFYLYNHEELAQAISEAREASQPILLIGVAFALLDFAEAGLVKLPPNAIVMETGGMKGRREELTRPELHERLCNGLGIEQISSEYGMTELLSQFYAYEQGRFQAPPWARVVISDLHLPDLQVPQGSIGRINVIDLANLHSCGFISTDDLGRMHEDGSFEVLGRIDHAELRGCSLMY